MASHDLEREVTSAMLHVSLLTFSFHVDSTTFACYSQRSLFEALVAMDSGVVQKK